MNLFVDLTFFNKTQLVGSFIYRKRYYLFFIIFALKLVFNLFSIGEHGLWYDECFSVNAANRPIADIIEISKSDQNPPLYPILLHFWIDLFGISEFAIRSMSALFSALACAGLFLLALKFFNWQTALFSILMYFSSNTIFYYSQEARTFACILLFVVCSYYCYLSLTKNCSLKKRLLFSFFLGLFNIGLFYLHYLSCFSIIAQGLLVPFFSLKSSIKIAKDGREIKSKINVYFIKYYCLSWVVFFLLYLPWHKRFLFLVTEGGKSFWLQKPIFEDFKNCIFELFTTPNLYLIYFYTFLVIMALLLFKKLRNENFDWRILLFAIISGPGLIYLNYLIASYSPIFLTRYVLFTFLGFILLFSYVFSCFRIWVELKIILFLILSYLSFSEMQIPRKIKADYRGAVSHLNTLKKDHVLITTDVPDLYSYYYDKTIFNEKNQLKKNELLFKQGIFAQIYDVDWPNRLDFSNIKDIYYTQSFEWLNDPSKMTMKNLNRNFECVQKIDQYPDIMILHYVNRNFKTK